MSVLGLVQSVGIDEQLFAPDVSDALAFERIVLPEAKRLVVVLHILELTIDDGRIMSAIAIVQSASV